MSGHHPWPPPTGVVFGASTPEGVAGIKVLYQQIVDLQAEVDALTAHGAAIQAVVNEQAADEELWFGSKGNSQLVEQRLRFVRQGLRRLHAVIEGESQEEIDHRAALLAESAKQAAYHDAHMDDPDEWDMDNPVEVWARSSPETRGPHPVWRLGEDGKFGWYPSDAEPESESLF